MKARSIASAIVLSAALAGTTGAGSGPRVRFEQDTHDFGEMRSDQKKNFTWTYFNDGDEPLRILETRPTCGCTAAVIGETSVPPGGKGSLEVTFDAAGQGGGIRKSVAVRSNDASRPMTLLTITAHVTPAAAPATPGGHPPIAGQSMLMGSCASCHAAPASQKSGTELWGAVCAMCHGAEAQGGRAPSLRDPSYLFSRNDRALADGIAYGTANPRMPGFSDAMGGPLTSAQIDSLVKLVRSWGPLPPVPGSKSAPGAAPPNR